MTATPANQEEVSAELKRASAAGLSVIPRGGGTKAGWGNPAAREDVVLSTARLNRVLEHAWADLTVTVEAGCTVSQLQQTLKQHGQRLAVDVLWPERATVGGILSSNESGALRLRYGALRDLIIGVTLALADGTIAMSGGRVVKNVAGYDLPKLATGALGTLGVITQAVFRLHPLPQNTRTFSISPGTLEHAQQLVLNVQNSKLAHSALQVRCFPGAEPVIDILIEGTEAGIAAQESAIRNLAGKTAVTEGPADVWAARENLWNGDGAIAKFSILPADISKTIGADWTAIVYATGIGWLRGGAASKDLRDLRSRLERQGGSLTVLRQPADGEPVEAWGNPGDALPLMRAVKSQFDPNNVLNPGRFAGGI